MYLFSPPPRLTTAGTGFDVDTIEIQGWPHRLVQSDPFHTATKIVRQPFVLRNSSYLLTDNWDLEVYEPMGPHPVRL